MTMQSRSNRYYWRQRNRRLLRLINALLAAMLLLAVLLPAVASAAPACPGGTATPYGCVYVVRGRLAVWPVVWPDGGRYAVTIDPEAQP